MESGSCYSKLHRFASGSLDLSTANNNNQYGILDLLAFLYGSAYP